MRDLVHDLADRKVDAIKLLSEGACHCPSSPKYVWQNPVFPAAVEITRLPTKVLRAGIEAAHERGLRVTVHTTQQVVAIEALEAGTDGLEHGITIEPITDKRVIDLLLSRDVFYTPTLWIHGKLHPDSMTNTKMVADAGDDRPRFRLLFRSRTIWANTLEEAELLVKAGISPAQELIAGTSRSCCRP